MAAPQRNNQQVVTEAAAAAAKPKKVRGIVHVNANRCKGCGFCIAFCPPKVLEFSDAINSKGYHPPRLANPDGCTGCDLCGLYCPDFAIYGVMLKYAPPPAGNGAKGAGGEQIPQGTTEQGATR